MSLPLSAAIVDEVFSLSDKMRWVGLTTDRGEVVVNQMRPGVVSRSPKEFDEDFLSLGPLTLIGVAEKYSEYLNGVEYVVVGFGEAVCVYARLGSHIISVSLERDQDALNRYLDWLQAKIGAMPKRLKPAQGHVAALQ